jgi:subtilisin-like proprotein convertase family protein
MRKALAALAIAGLASAASAQTFSSNTLINLPSGQPGTTSGPADPYPSGITVSGVSGATGVTITLNGLSHTFPADLDVLLVAPSGTVMLMSDAGGGDDVVGIDLTFADGSPAIPSVGPLSTGTFGPFNYGTGDIMAAPAPAGPYGSSLNALAASANGTWNLFIVDDAGGDFGTLNGWSVTFVPAPGTMALFGIGGLLAARRRRA